MSSVLVSVPAQAIVLGPGSIGPFPVPADSAGLVIAVRRDGMPALPKVISVACLVSHDNGKTFNPLVSVEIPGGDIPQKGGKGILAETDVTVYWHRVPTHVRLDLTSYAAFTTAFRVESI